VKEEVYVVWHEAVGHYLHREPVSGSHEGSKELLLVAGLAKDLPLLVAASHHVVDGAREPDSKGSPHGRLSHRIREGTLWGSVSFY